MSKVSGKYNLSKVTQDEKENGRNGQYAQPSQLQVPSPSLYPVCHWLAFLKYLVYLLTPTFQNLWESLLAYLMPSFYTNLPSSSTFLKGTLPHPSDMPIPSHSPSHQCHLAPGQISPILQGLNRSVISSKISRLVSVLGVFLLGILWQRHITDSVL